MLEKIAYNLKLNILNVDFMRVGKFWKWKNVNSPFSRLYLITKGKAYVKFNNRNYKLEPMNMYLIPCFMFHNYYCEDFMEHYFVHFTSRIYAGEDLFTIQKYKYKLRAGDEALQLFKRLVELNPHKKLNDLNPKKKVNIEPDFESMNMAENDNFNINLSRIMESRGILSQLLSGFLKTAKGIDNADKLYAVFKLENVLKYIDYNLDKDIQLKDMAKQAHLNPTYFSNLFAKLMKQRPTQYLNRKRVEKAQILLTSTDLKLKEICVRAGIKDPNYFSRLFKKYIGIPPAKYRKHQRQQAPKKLQQNNW